MLKMLPVAPLQFHVDRRGRRRILRRTTVSNTPAESVAPVHALPRNWAIGRDAARDPSPLVIRTMRTRPAAARRCAWSYVTVRRQPITRPHGSSGDTPTRPSHASPSSDLCPGATEARLTAPTSQAPQRPRTASPAVAQPPTLGQLPVFPQQIQPPTRVASLPHPHPIRARALRTDCFRPRVAPADAQPHPRTA